MNYKSYLTNKGDKHMYSIAIDGPSASGKSSVADEVARKLNILHLNTGELYRAIGYYAYDNGFQCDLDDEGMPKLSESDVHRLIKNVVVDVKFINGRQHTYVNNEDVTPFLHTPIISDYSSRVSAIPKVRDHVLELQRSIARTQNVVMDGRDITSHVLPKSKYKFYITASVEERANRRFLENKRNGIVTTYEKELEDLQLRDKRDTTRKVCPLVIVPDAVVIDTTEIGLEEVVAKVLSYIKEN